MVGERRSESSFQPIDKVEPQRLQPLVPGLLLSVGVMCGTVALGADNAPNDRASKDAAQLIAHYGCHACHAAKEQKIGPPFEAVAIRYAAQRAKMEEVLAAKVRFGGGGNWGVVPMVANDSVTVEDARTMVRWILTTTSASESNGAD